MGYAGYGDLLIVERLVSGNGGAGARFSCHYLSAFFALSCDIISLALHAKIDQDVSGRERPI